MIEIACSWLIDSWFSAFSFECLARLRLSVHTCHSKSNWVLPTPIRSWRLLVFIVKRWFV
jgi:hypothetical protein